MNNTTNFFSVVLLFVGVLLAVSYCMPEPDAQPDPQNIDGIQGQRYGRGRYGMNNYYSRYGRGFGMNQRLGRGFYSPSIGYYSPYYYNPYSSSYFYNNPYSYYLGYYSGYGGYGQSGLNNRYGMYNRNRNGYDNYGGGSMGGMGGMGGGMNGGMGGMGGGGDSEVSQEQ